jgi:hypothetical protein
MQAVNEFKVGDAEIRRVEEMPIKSPMWSPRALARGATNGCR